jgi:hypothetical protein
MRKIIRSTGSRRPDGRDPIDAPAQEGRAQGHSGPNGLARIKLSRRWWLGTARAADRIVGCHWQRHPIGALNQPPTLELSFIDKPKEENMADDKTKIGGTDRRRVAAEQQYEVSYFARKHKISSADARSIIQQAGNSREKANDLASKARR